ncbi:MAG: ATP-binding protein [Patescibacteria group bacterium]|jgi:signal transduction histidine kinase
MQNIKKKILISFFTIIAVLLISESFFISMDRLILSKYRNLATNMISEFTLIGDSSNLVSSFDKRIKSPFDSAEISRFNLIYSDTKNILARLNQSIVNNKSRVVFNGLENNINDVMFDIEIGVNNLSAGDYLEAVSRYEAASRKNTFVQENVNKLLLEEFEYAKNLQVEIDRINLISVLLAILLLVLTTGGCIWYAFFFSDKLIMPLIKLTKLAWVIEGGNLDVEVDKALLEGNDEFAILANSFHTMIISLKSSVQKLQEYNTEIKNSRNHLKSEKRKLQQYLDVAGVLVLIFDVNNNVLLINKKGREILKIEAGDIMGKDWVSLFVKKADQTNTRSLLNFLVGDISPSDKIENVLIAKDKSEKNIVWHFSILKNDNNISQAILGTGVDVTELAAAKVTINQLKEVDRLKNEVLNIATHELKTPLISIVGLSEVMEKQPKTMPEDYKGFISLIHAEGLKLTNLIKTMLTASRNEIGKTAVTLEKLVFDELVLSMETSLGVLAKRSDSKVAFDIQAKGIKMTGDKLKISQVVYNFVDNAVKYGPKNQTITVAVAKPDADTVRLAVTGAGQGISKEKQKSLFLKFSQLEPSLSRSQDGMGLGLYICKQNIESLGGRIGVISELGQGATFFFTLPLVQAAPLAKTPVVTKDKK